MLSPAFLDELRARTLLSALIGKTTKLQKAGREFRACCPFHNEKSPSFYVNDDKGFYHCFGCGAHGDAIRWMTDQRGLPFIDAVKDLVQTAGMEMPAQDRRAVERAERAKDLYQATEDAARFFAQTLNGIEGGDARALLKRRGISEETARAFGLGFAPDSRAKLREALRSYGDPMLVQGGLLISVEGKEPYDRFRGRLMIPIRDVRGRAIAFGGRIIGPGEPKYLNSPETPLFDKGRTLYNLDRALPAARRAGRIVAVEGYMDVIALAQSGFAEAVAPLGTALTEHQLERLWRIADVPLLCFDGDSAGQKAALRAARRALPMLQPGQSLAFVTMPDGQDPDDLVRAHGAAAFEALLQKARPLVQMLWEHELSAEPLDTPEKRAGLKRRLIELTAAIREGSVRAEYVAEFRLRFDGLHAGRQAMLGSGRPRGGKGRGANPAILPLVARTRAVQAAGLEVLLARAALAGLVRNPGEIPRHMEALATLRSSLPAVARAIDSVIDVGLGGAADLGALEQHLGVGDIGLTFSFNQPGADPVRARADLATAIAACTEIASIERDLGEATSRFAETFEAQWFERQQLLLQARQGIEQRLADLAAAEHEAPIPD